MRMAAFAVGVLAVSCGPTQQKRDTERAALAALAEHEIATVRRNHACDEPRAEQRRAHDSYLAALRAPQAVNMSAWEAHRIHEEAAHEISDKAEAKVAACEGMLPDWKELRARRQQLADAWMDACLLCTTGRACVDAERRRRDSRAAMTDADPAAAIASLEAMKSGAACSGAGR
jgi:hypothetical protein